jgi:hypothetical protein
MTIFFIGFFVGLEKYGMDVFYNRKFQKWLVSNSTDAESLNSENNNFEPEFDINGFITNVKFTPFENSIALIEVDFIEEQFRRLAFFDLTKLKSKHIRVIKTYERYLKEKLNQPQQTEAIKSDELLKNTRETIFKDDFAFTLFDKMKQYYSDTKTPQADYSFLFDIMQNDGFVICTGTKFVGYLVEDFDIKMTKIDSFKTGNKQKTKLYIATKENLQKKHGLSTI